MVDSKNVAESAAYMEFEQKHNRHLNMLQENDRNLRRQALNEFNKVMDREKDTQIIDCFYRDKLVRRTIICLDDQIEKNREVAIDIMTK